MGENILRVLRKIRACEGEAAAQVVLEHFLSVRLDEAYERAEQVCESERLHKESANRIDELQNLLERFSYAVEGHAWAMPPPNVWTPVFLSTVNAVRGALCDIKAGRQKHDE